MSVQYKKEIKQPKTLEIVSLYLTLTHHCLDTQQENVLDKVKRCGVDKGLATNFFKVVTRKF